MKKKGLLLVGLLCAATGASQAQRPAGRDVAEVVAKAVGALARLNFTYFNEIVGRQERMGQCVCIDANKGVFITRDVPGVVPANELMEFSLVVPGTADRRFDAELMGTDPEENLSFLRIVPEKDPEKLREHPWLKNPPWKALPFARVGLKLGQEVVAVGLLPPKSGNVPYVGLARVACKLRLPYEVIYVSGGDLTVASSPVLTLDGRVVGLVDRQMPMDFRMLVRNRWTEVGLAGLQSTRFFVPVTEFAHVLEQIPQKGSRRTLSWLGAWEYDQVSSTRAGMLGLGDRAAVLVGRVKAGSPATTAKPPVKQSDVIIGLNGKPLEKLATPVLTVGNFRRKLYRFKPGTRISLTIFREKRRFEAQVTLGPMPTQRHEAARYYNAALGIACRDLVDFDRYPRRTEALQTKCALVTMVRPNSPAALGQMLAGDLITHVGDKPTASVRALEAVIKAQAAKSEPLQFMVERLVQGKRERKVLMIKLPRP